MGDWRSRAIPVDESPKPTGGWRSRAVPVIETAPVAAAPLPSPVPKLDAARVQEEEQKAEPGFFSKAATKLSQGIDDAVQYGMTVGRDVPEPSLGEEVMFPGYASAAKFAQQKVVAPAWKLAQGVMSGPLNAAFMGGKMAGEVELSVGRVVGSLATGAPLSKTHQQAIDEWHALRDKFQSDEWLRRHDAGEYLAREMASALGGDAVRVGAVRDPETKQVSVNPDNPEILQALNDLESTAGVKGSAFLQSFAQGLGELPLYIGASKAKAGETAAASLAARISRAMETGPKSQTFAGTVLKAADRAFNSQFGKAVVANTVEGAGFGELNAVKDPEADMALHTGIGAGAGAVLGGALTGAELVVPKAAQGIRKAAPKAWKAVFPVDEAGGKELRKAIFDASLRTDDHPVIKDILAIGAKDSEDYAQKYVARDMAAEAQQLAAVGEVGKKEMKREWPFKEAREKLPQPFAFGIYESAEGKVIGRAIQIRARKNAPPEFLYHDTELPHDDAAVKWVEKYNVHGSQLNIDPKIVEGIGKPGNKFEDIDRAMERAIARDIAHRMNTSEAPKVEEPFIGPKEESVAEAAVRVMKEVRAVEPDVQEVIGVKQNGTMGGRPSNVPRIERRAVEMPKKGDPVTVKTGDGKETGGIFVKDVGDGNVRVKVEVVKRRGSVVERVLKVKTVPREAVIHGHTASAKKEVSKAIRNKLLTAEERAAVDALQLIGKQSKEQSLDYFARRKEAENYALEWFGILRPQDLSNYIGHTPGDAAEAIARMEAEGTKVVDGVAIHAPSWKDTSTPDEGMFVYFGKPTDPQGVQTAVFRGPDPKVKGNFLLELPDPEFAPKPIDTPSMKGLVTTETQTISVPREQFNDARPVHLADEVLAKSPNVWGMTKPLPPGVVLTKDTSEAFQAMVKLGDNIDRQIGRFGMASVKRAVEALKRVFQGEHLSPTPYVKNGKFSLYGQKAQLFAAREVEADMRQRATDAIVKASGLDIRSQAAKDLEPIQRLRATKLPGEDKSPQLAAIEEWVKTHGPEAKAAKGLVTDMMTEIKLVQDELRREMAGVDLGPDFTKLEIERALGNEDEYVRQVYNYFRLREKWIEHLQKQTPEVWEAALRFFNDQAALSGKVSDPNKVIAGLKQALHETGPHALSKNDAVNALVKAGALDANAAKSLLSKKELPKPLRDLLGPETSGLITIPDTLARAKAVLAQVRAWNQIAESPMFSRAFRMDLPVAVPLRPEFGKAAGGYVSKDFADLVNPKTVEQQTNLFLRMLAGTPGRMWKRNVTVFGGPGVWMSNIARNFKGAVLGGMDPFEFNKNAEAFAEAARSLVEYGKNPTRFGKGSLVEEAMRFNVLPPGMGKAELTSRQARLDAQVLHEFRQKRPVMETLIKLKDHFAEAADDVTEGYDSIDRIFKLATYIARRRENLLAGMSVHDAAAEASLRVNQSFPNFGTMSKFVEAVRNRGFGAIAPFFSSKMEDVRVNATAVGRLLEGNERGLRARVMKLGLLMGGLYGGVKASRYANGISDKMVADDWARQPQAVRSMNKAPVCLGFDSQGRMVYADLTSYEDLLMSMKGSPLDSSLSNFARSNLMDIVGDGTLQGRAIDTAFAAFGNETARQNLQVRNLPRPGQAEPIGAVEMLIREGALVPQAPFRLQSALELGGVGRSLFDNREVFTPLETAAKAAGVHLHVTGPMTDYAASKDVRGGYKALKSAGMNVGRDSKGDPADAMRRMEGSAGRFQDVVNDFQTGRKQ